MPGACCNAVARALAAAQLPVVTLLTVPSLHMQSHPPQPVEDEAHQRGQSPTQKPIMAHVPSSGYGLTCPATVPRPHREDGPKWLPAGPKEGIAEPAAPPPPARINDIVGSHGYGTVSPAKGKRKPVEFGPVWVPNSKNTTGALPDPPPAPPRKEIPVGSQYRKGEYLP